MTRDPAETDPAALSSSEELDEDRLKVDPLEEGVDPPERWSEAGHFGTTASERHEGESIDERIAEERPDVDAAEPDPRRPTVAATPATELDETVDALGNEAERTEADSVPAERDTVTTQRQNADEAGGSVADTIRTPPEPPR